MEPTKFDIKFATLRRVVIENNFARMNDRQQEAVFHTEGPLLILAGAGSGKTTVLIQRITNILEFGKALESSFAPVGATQEDLMFLAEYSANPQPETRARAHKLCAYETVRPWEILAITFTNKAARELRERLTQSLGSETAQAIWAHTFHTACLRILRRDIEKLGYDTNFTIYDEDDKKRTIVGILKRLQLDEKMFDPRQVMGMISRAKDSLLTPKSYAVSVAGDHYKSRVAEIYTLYEKEMRASNAMDFDDIIMKTVQLLRDNEDIRTYYQRKFHYVMVDEYQDTNHAQYVLCGLLAGGYENICVVGDDDQSIYKFRGATITNILEFEQQYANAKVIRLEQNYRSTDTILAAANAVIDHNVQRKGKELWTDRKNGSKIKLHRSDSQDGEAQYIAQSILEGVAQGRKFSDYAVLYRNNVLSGNIETAFRRSAVPYRIYKGRDFFSRAEIKDMFAYLWVIENPADTLRLKRIINVPARKIGDRSVEVAEQEAAQNNLDLYQVVGAAGVYPSLSRVAAAMQRFWDMIEDLRQKRTSCDLSELYEELLMQSGYQAALEAKDDMESRSRLEHIQELKSSILDYEKRTEEPSLSGFLEEMALYTDADSAEDGDDVVTLMTMHAAKGLEFPAVFVCGMEEGIFPSFRAADNQDDMEEERRLCYVAITRAKRQLYLTFAERRMIYGKTQYGRPSVFLDEVPKELVDSNISERARVVANVDMQIEKSYRVESFGSAQRANSMQPKPATKTAPVPNFAVGDSVEHRAFGRGVVQAVKPMGNDLLLEINFETKGNKRLMARMASAMMQKL